MTVDTKLGIRDVYRHHHEVGGRFGRTVMEEVRAPFFKKHVGIGKRVLDVGCRDGTLTKYFTKDNQVLGLDIDDEALRIAKGNLDIEIKQVDLNGDWGVSEGAFDVVVASEVIEHLYFPEQVIEKITHALKNDGVLLGSVPNAFSLQMRIRFFLGRKKATPLNDPTHINHFLHHELKALLEEHFETVSFYPEGNYAWLDRIFPGWFSFMILFEALNPKKS